MRVGIVYGGTSSEAEASEKNAKSIEGALRTKGYDVLMLEYGPDMIRRIRDNAVDIVYLCVQGKYHGDGTLQAMLDHEGIPYTGSKTQAAMLINDKILCKLLFDYYRIPTPKWRILRKEEYRQKRFDYDEIGFPFVGKAPRKGENMRDEQLLAYLKGSCSGRKNRVGGTELERTLHVSGTDLRKLVNQLQRKTHPIASDRSGYFYATTAGEVYDTIRQLKRMAAGLEAAINGLERSMDRFREDEEAGHG